MSKIAQAFKLVLQAVEEGEILIVDGVVADSVFNPWGDGVISSAECLKISTLRHALGVKNIEGDFDVLYPALADVFTSLPHKDKKDIILDALQGKRTSLNDWYKEQVEMEEYEAYHEAASMNWSDSEETLFFTTATSGREVMIWQDSGGVVKCKIFLDHSITAAQEVLCLLVHKNNVDNLESVTYQTDYGQFSLHSVELDRHELLWLNRHNSIEDYNAFHDNDTPAPPLSGMSLNHAPAWIKEAYSI